MPDLEEMLASLEGEIRTLKGRGGSRYVGSGADPAVVDHVASGGSVKRGNGTPHGDWTYGTKSVGGGRTIEPGRGGGPGKSLAQAILDVKLGRVDGMTSVYESKALAEATGSAGGYLLPIERIGAALVNRVVTAALHHGGVALRDPWPSRFDPTLLPGGGLVVRLSTRPRHDDARRASSCRSDIAEGPRSPGSKRSGVCDRLS